MGFLDKLRKKRERQAWPPCPACKPAHGAPAPQVPDYEIEPAPMARPGFRSQGMRDPGAWGAKSSIRRKGCASCLAPAPAGLGDHLSLSAFVDDLAHIKDYGGTRGDVVIGSDCWICTDALILSGVTNRPWRRGGSRAPWSPRRRAALCGLGGNPHASSSGGVPEATCQALLDIAWWDWPEAESSPPRIPVHARYRRLHRLRRARHPRT